MLRRFTIAAALAGLLAGANVPAGIVEPLTGNLGLDPLSVAGLVGEDVNLTLQGAGFSVGTYGGDFSIQWNPAHLQFMDFVVGVLTFRILAGLATVNSTTVSVLAASGPAVGWFDTTGRNQYDVSYGQAQVAVVPAPPAFWLLLTAVSGAFAHRVRRSKASQ